MKRVRYQRSDARSSFVISSSRFFRHAVVGGARVRSARGARRDGNRGTGRWTRGGTRCAEKTAGIDITNGTYPPPRRRREWATCPCCWYTRIRRRSLRRGTPWRARCGSARAGCRRSFPVASGRRDARVAVPGLERTLATSTQRAAGESGAVRGVERSWLLFLAKSEKDPNESPIRAVFSWFQSRADPMKSWRFDRSDPMKHRAEFRNRIRNRARKNRPNAREVVIRLPKFSRASMYGVTRDEFAVAPAQASALPSRHPRRRSRRGE